MQMIIRAPNQLLFPSLNVPRCRYFFATPPDAEELRCPGCIGSPAARPSHGAAADAVDRTNQTSDVA